MEGGKGQGGKRFGKGSPQKSGYRSAAKGSRGEKGGGTSEGVKIHKIGEERLGRRMGEVAVWGHRRRRSKKAEDFVVEGFEKAFFRSWMGNKARITWRSG